MTPNVSLQLVQQEGSEFAAQAGSAGEGRAGLTARAVGEPVRRPLRDRAVNVVHLVADETQTNLDGHLNVIAALEPKLHRRVRRGPVEAGNGHVGVVAPAALHREGGLQTLEDHVRNAARGGGSGRGLRGGRHWHRRNGVHDCSGRNPVRLETIRCARGERRPTANSRRRRAKIFGRAVGKIPTLSVVIGHRLWLVVIVRLLSHTPSLRPIPIAFGTSPGGVRDTFPHAPTLTPRPPNE